MNILDRRFKWVPARDTDVTQVWRRYGWRPLSEKEREQKVTEIAKRRKQG